MEKMTILWLDDIRCPYSDIWRTWIECYRDNTDENNFDIVWVKNYKEFCDWINKNSLPDEIYFDHDLGDVLENELHKNGMSKKEARKRKQQEKTGYDCAKFLVDYCLDRDIDIPVYGIQSSNGPGSENINGLLTNYHNFYKQKHYGEEN